MNWQESDPRFRHLGLKIGLFSLGAVLLLAVFLYALAVRQGYFVSKSPVHFEAVTGTDLRVGMPVKLSGFKIGEVYRVGLNQRAHVDVEMRIEDQYLRWIRTDSVVMLAKEGLIGDSFLSVSPGSEGLPQAGPRDRLRFQYGRGLADIAEDVRNRVTPVIDEMYATLKYLNDPKGDVRQEIRALRQLTEEFRETRRHMDELVVHMNAVTRNDVPQTLEETRATMAQARQALAQVEQALPPLLAKSTDTLERFGKTADQAQQAADHLDQLLQESRPKVNRLLDDSQQLVTEGRAVVKQVKVPWLLRGKPAAEASATP